MAPDLEQRLRALAVEWPETPDLAGAVAERLQAPDRAARRRPAWRVQWATVALVLAGLLGAAMAVEPARSAILEFLGLDGARIERREPVATPAPTLAPGLGAGLDLGERVTAAQAARRADFEVAPPAALPAPGAVYFQADRPDGGMVSYVYAPQPGIPRAPQTGAGLLVSAFLATVEPVIAKAAGEGTTVERLRVDGDRGYWLSGRPHGFAFIGRDGAVDFQEQRLAAPTLLLERGELLIRVEGRVSKDRAIAIARSIR